MKIYVVVRGRKIGFYFTWEEVEPLVKGFKGVKHKSFHILEDAINYF